MGGNSSSDLDSSDSDELSSTSKRKELCMCNLRALENDRTFLTFFLLLGCGLLLDLLVRGRRVELFRVDHDLILWRPNFD